ncbi:MAG: mevalonate kinase [Thermoprotei archaeon]|nr:MAG: mevalonate kinase [Thermofilum sp. ex4484_79]RLE61669.1 MAG: mevalonate kinase [Thermoprotei archaeon]HDD63990.1 mevalonate kinase [Thermoprotei archaeon]
MTTIVKASAPGKVIISGEHFVVEGQPAIAAAINLRAKVSVSPTSEKTIELFSKNYNLGVKLHDLEIISTIGSRELCVKIFKPSIFLIKKLCDLSGEKYGGFKITIDSKVPPGSGMGSSAATSVAFTAALAKFLNLQLSKNEINSIAYEAEKIVHGKPSGIDNTVSTFGGIIAYRKGEGFIRLKPKISEAYFVLADSGIERVTGDVVRNVLKLKERFPKIFDPIYHAAGRLAIRTALAIEEGDLEKLGQLMNINHGLLSAIGVSNLVLENLVYTARKNGALGAKITGAGAGGFIMALCDNSSLTNVKKALRAISRRVYVVKISKPGVLVRKET